MDVAGLPLRLDPMRLRDVPAVVTLERRVFSAPWPASAFVYELTHNSHSHYHVLRRAAASGTTLPPGLLGYCGYWLALDEAHVATLAVHPGWRGRGLGELLFGTMVREARAAGAVMVTLEVRESNIAARNLYSKYGLEVTGRRRAYYTDNGEDALIMTAMGVADPAYGLRLERLAEEQGRRLRESFADQAHPTD
ncbi:MAG: ribosomal protein S18-alanine N-acetyltransferase [Anaerolineae bacterium]|jgi:ribosomal-protein-alanine N-acetyltransferase